MSRRSRPPRNRKARSSESPAHDVAVIIPPTTSVASVEGHLRGEAPSIAPPIALAADELAELDAGWD